jgi:chromosome segregation ATPase
LGGATHAVFDAIDRSLVVARDRVEKARGRVEAAKITTEEVEQSLKDWAKRQAGKRVAEKLKVAERTEQLTVTMNQADQWLEVSQSSVELVQQVLSLASSAGAAVDVGAVDAIHEDIASLRSKLADATEVVDEIHRRTSGEDSLETWREQAVRSAVHAVVTLSSIDSRLKGLEGKLAEVGSNLVGQKATLLRSFSLGAVVSTFLLAWMAAGQAALCGLGWKYARGNLTPPLEELPPPG